MCSILLINVTSSYNKGGKLLNNENWGRLEDGLDKPGSEKVGVAKGS